MRITILLFYRISLMYMHVTIKKVEPRYRIRSRCLSHNLQPLAVTAILRVRRKIGWHIRKTSGTMQISACAVQRCRRVIRSMHAD